MFYISSKKYFGSDIKYGVTDTSDGIEEFYTESELASLFKQTHTHIKGMDFTCSGFRFKVTNTNIILADSLRLGDIALFDLNGTMKYGIYLDITSLGDGYYFYFDGKDSMKITKSKLLDNSCKLVKSEEGHVREALYRKFKEVAPNHNLWLYRSI